MMVKYYSRAAFLVGNTVQVASPQSASTARTWCGLAALYALRWNRCLDIRFDDQHHAPLRTLATQLRGNLVAPDLEYTPKAQPVAGCAISAGVEPPTACSCLFRRTGSPASGPAAQSFHSDQWPRGFGAQAACAVS